LRQARILREKPIAGVDEIRAAAPRRADDRFGKEVALPGVRRSDANGVIRELHVERVLVRLGKDRYR
jgi:hypothetical protein